MVKGVHCSAPHTTTHGDSLMTYNPMPFGPQLEALYPGPHTHLHNARRASGQGEVCSGWGGPENQLFHTHSD